MRILVTAALLCLFAGPLSADVVTLKTGKEIEGTITRRDDKTLEINTARGVQRYSFQYIEAIETPTWSYREGEGFTQPQSTSTGEPSSTGQPADPQQAFLDSFKGCVPGARYELVTKGAEGREPEFIVVYKITGPVTGGCALRAVFSKSSFDVYLDKSMTCVYDPEKDFLMQKSDLEKCSGPLADLFKQNRGPREKDAQ